MRCITCLTLVLAACTSKHEPPSEPPPPEKPAEAVTDLQAAQNGQSGADADGSAAEDNVGTQSPVT